MAMAIAFTNIMADSRETVLVNGISVDKTANRLTFSSDEVSLLYDDGSKNVFDLSNVNIAFKHIAVFKSYGNDNIETIKTYGGCTLPVETTVSLAQEKWSTICFPFDVPSSSLATIFGNGTLVATLKSSTVENINFVTVDNIIKGMPYLIKPSKNVYNFTLDNITIGTMSEGSTVSSETCLFIGNIENLGASLSGVESLGLMGDVNNDNEVNVSDVTTIVNNILDSSVSINALLGDMDNSGDITISDVTLLINAILDGTNIVKQPAILINGEESGLTPNDLQQTTLVAPYNHSTLFKSDTETVVVPGKNAILYQDVVNNTVSRNVKANQVLVETTDGSILFYNTEDVSSIEIDEAQSKVIISSFQGDTDIYYGTVRNISFSKGMNGTFHYNSATNGESYILGDFMGGKRLKTIFTISRSGTNNPCFNFKKVNIEKSGTETTVHSCGDDIAPGKYNYSYIGANHGNAQLRLLTCQAHGKTYADIGSKWRKDKKTFTIVGIAGENGLYVLGANTKTYPLFRFNVATAGTYVHLSGAVHTEDIVATAADVAQLKPSLEVSNKAIFVDGKEVTEDGDYQFRRLDICEEYDVYNVASVLEKIQENVGDFTSNPAYNQLGADKVAKHSTVYTFFGADLWFINTSLTFYQKANLDYFGFTQQMILSGSSSKMYIPKVLPVANGTIDFRTIANFGSVSSEINLKPNTWENPSLPPDRWLQYTNSIGLTSGYLFDYGIGGYNRKDLIGNAFMISKARKVYPFGVGGFANNIGVNAGDSFSAIAFRRYFDRSTLNANGVICAHTFEYDNKMYIYADYNAEGIYEIDIPANFLGKNVEVFEKSANVTLQTTLPTSKLQVKVESASPMYGYLVAQIK